MTSLTLKITALILAFGMISCKTTGVTQDRMIDLEEYRKKHLPNATDDILLSKVFAIPNLTGIIFSPRKYFLTDPIEIIQPIKIEGKGASLIFPSPTTGHLIKIAKTKDVEISNLSITVVGESDRLLYGIEIFQAQSCKLKDVRIHDSAMSGVSVKACSQISFNECNFENLTPHHKNNVDGVFIGGDQTVEEIIFKNCRFTNIGGDKRKVSGQLQDGDGIQVLGTPNNNQISTIKILGCAFVNCSARGIKFQSGTNLIVTDSEFTRCNIGVSFALDQPIESVQLDKNNAMECNLAFSVYSQDPNTYLKGATISNNEVKNCNYFLRVGPPIIDATIVENKATDLGYCFYSGNGNRLKILRNSINGWGRKKDKSFDMAIFLAASSDQVTISDNEFNVPGYIGRGILVKKRNTNITIADNKFFQNATSKVKFRMIQSSVKESNMITMSNNKLLNLN